MLVDHEIHKTHETKVRDVHLRARITLGSVTGSTESIRTTNGNPKLTDLQSLATKDRVVLVLGSHYANAKTESEAGRDYSKVKIATAALTRGLTRTCVLGASLAEKILRHVAPTRTVSATAPPAAANPTSSPRASGPEA